MSATTPESRSAETIDPWEVIRKSMERYPQVVNGNVMLTAGRVAEVAIRALHAAGLVISPTRPLDETWIDATSNTVPDPAPAEARRVPDLPCPACGETAPEVAIRFCRPSYAMLATGGLCYGGDPAHFHRSCCRCKYEWRTDDVLTTPSREQTGA